MMHFIQHEEEEEEEAGRQADRQAGRQADRQTSHADIACIPSSYHISIISSYIIIASSALIYHTFFF
jgi:hypothetical protein